jgi:hypothetical protein
MSAPKDPKTELSQRDRDMLREFLDSMCTQLLKDGGVTVDSVSEVSTSLMLDVDGLWVDMAREAAR